MSGNSAAGLASAMNARLTRPFQKNHAGTVHSSAVGTWPITSTVGVGRSARLRTTTRLVIASQWATSVETPSVGAFAHSPEAARTVATGTN
ncbi:MAG: hypothetical protein ACI9YT_002534 [Halobacteriales archaeon]|jgi:hypothetical protein